MSSSLSKYKVAAVWMLASAVVAAPSFAFADRDHDRHRGGRHERVDRDDRWSEHDAHGDRCDDRRSGGDCRERDRDHCARDREVRRERHVIRGCERPVRVVEVYRRPAPRFTVAVQFGRPSCPPPPVCYPQPVCNPAPAPICGAYYDPYCDARYASFELYIAHLTRTHGITVAVRN